MSEREVTPRSAPLIALAILALVGMQAVDDYGITYDETDQRHLAAATVLHIIGRGGGDGDILRQHNIRTYGVAFELPLLLVEIALGLDDLRSVYLARHCLTHLFFLTGGLCCFLLVRRMGGGRTLALFAMLLFLLHPRLYAESFFNTKDLPFLSMFMIALLLVHRAFRKDDFAAFISCGLAVGVLTNIRILGVMLFVAVIGLRLLDLLLAADGRERRRILATIGFFVASSLLVLYASWPYLWIDPIGRFAEVILHMAHHPERIYVVFQGEVLDSADVPPHYIPTWIAITTPPVTLALGGIGLLAVLCRSVAHPERILCNGALRFEMLLAACLMLPVLAVVLLGSHLYGGWRHMYFLHAPFAILTALGLAQLTACSHAPLRWAAYGLTGAGLMATLIQMAAMHPNQSVYFNFLVDRHTPENLREQYDLGGNSIPAAQGLQALLDDQTESAIRLRFGVVAPENLAMLTEDDRRRFVTPPPGHSNFLLYDHHRHTSLGRKQTPFAPSIYDKKIYNTMILSVLALDLALLDEAAGEPYRALHRSLAHSKPIMRSNFDVHLRGRTLYYIKPQCRQEDAHAEFMLRITPSNADDLMSRQRQNGFTHQEFLFGEIGVRFDGNCLAAVPLPDYDIAHATVGQIFKSRNKFRKLNRCWTWRETILFDQQQTARICNAGQQPCPPMPSMPQCEPMRLTAIE